MKNIKHGLTLIALTVLVITLVGCGVNKDEHQKVVSELKETKEQLGKANDKIAQLEKSLAGAKAQEKPSVEKPVKMETPAKVDTIMQDKLAAAQQETTNLRAKVESLTKENSSLKGMLEKLKGQLAELESKLKGMKVPSGNIGSDLLKNR
jgi:chromosome segregation ATPase